MFLAVLCLFNAVIICTDASVEVCTPIGTNIRRIQEYNDKRITESSMWATNLPMGKCLEKCYLDKKCVSVNLLPKTESCTGFNRPFEGLIAQTEAVPGYQLFEINLSFLCTTNEYCSNNFHISHCYDNRCRCPIGYGFDVTTCRMLTECASFSNVYTLYPRYAKWGYTLNTGTDQTLSSCANLCINDPVCESADFQPSTGTCWTSGLTWLEVPVADRELDSDHYTTIQRECNW